MAPGLPAEMTCGGSLREPVGVAAERIKERTRTQEEGRQKKRELRSEEKEKEKIK